MFVQLKRVTLTLALSQRERELIEDIQHFVDIENAPPNPIIDLILQVDVQRQRPRSVPFPQGEGCGEGS